MALTLVVEDGSGRTDANSYATAAEGDIYHESHPYGASWAALDTPAKERALVYATRLIEQAFVYRWLGSPVNNVQVLSWPRWGVPVAAGAAIFAGYSAFSTGFYSGFLNARLVPSTIVPDFVKNATSELARLVIESDRAKAANAPRVVTRQIGDTSVTYESGTEGRLQVIPDSVTSMLAKYLDQGSRVIRA